MKKLFLYLSLLALSACCTTREEVIEQLEAEAEAQRKATGEQRCQVMMPDPNVLAIYCEDGTVQFFQRFDPNEDGSVKDI